MNDTDTVWIWDQPVGPAAMEDEVVLSKMRNLAQWKADKVGAVLSDADPTMICDNKKAPVLRWTGIIPLTGQS